MFRLILLSVAIIMPEMGFVWTWVANIESGNRQNSQIQKKF